MTVYDYCHLGHARVLVVFDSVVRWLQALGFKVIYVRNITDIDDKIIQRALANGESIKALTDRYIEAMQEDAAALGVTPPAFEPRATECIDSMLAMVSALLAKNLAYTASNGDVYYAVHNFPYYGKLSGKSLEDLRAGERVEIDGSKRDPLDFVLWKAAKPDEPSWDSPWGKGRPGWHIECSAMSEYYLGAQFDIHGGGQDLQFPHHENEIAQSEGVHGHQHVNYWMHNGFVRVDNEKMSKSLGNFFTVREVLARYQPEVVRFFILRAHYRSPLNYSDVHLDDAKNAMERLYTVLKNHDGIKISIDWEQDSYALRFMTAMNDDFNTPEAIAVLFDLAGEANRTGDPCYAALLKSLGGILGLMQQSPQQFFQQSTGSQNDELEPAAIEHLIQQRLQARHEKDFAKADALRQQLNENGIILEDNVHGTTWRRA